MDRLGVSRETADGERGRRLRMDALYVPFATYNFLLKFPDYDFLWQNLCDSVYSYRLNFMENCGTLFDMYVWFAMPTGFRKLAVTI